MKLTVFRSDKGDCLLLTTKDKKRLLVDGGMGSSFKEHVAPALAALKPKKLDVVYVSHIDDDHIGGILELMDDVVAWRVHRFQVKSGNKKHKAPSVPEPPEVRELWHNAFKEQVGANNAEEITDMLAQAATALANAGPNFQRLSEHHEDLATSTRQALVLARRASPSELGLDVNRPAKGKLMLVRKGAKPFKLGTMTVRIVGPFEADLQKLRDEWNDWLDENKPALATIREESKRVEGGLGNTAKAVLEARSAAFREFAAATQARLPGPELAAAVRKLGNRSRVTTPNLASLMLLVEEGGQTVLLTGDGHSDDVERALKQWKKLDAKGNLHVNVLKALHHGSEHDITEGFCSRVTADHYVFCGNGFQGNPELPVIEAMVNARLNGAGPDRPFKLWFNANPKDKKAKYKKHLSEIDKTLKKLAAKSGKRMTFEFIDPNASSFDVL
jgi:beta-lactamase superfamily II metal-dependent hydrolase